MWSYNNPVKILFGNDGLASIASLIDGRSYALVTYPDSPFQTLTDYMTKAAGKPLIVVNDIAPNPDFKLLSEQSARFASLISGPEVIVALGGGSVIDSAKVFAAAGGDFNRVQRHWKPAVANLRWQPFQSSPYPQQQVQAVRSLPLQLFGMRNVGANSLLRMRACILK